MNLNETAAALREIRGELNDLNGRLSESEEQFMAEANAQWKPKGLPVAEIDCDLTFSGNSFPVTLKVWGTFHKAMKGGHEPGERPYEPDSPAYFDVDCVMWGETDVTGEFSLSAIEDIGAHILENYEW